jgi:hypothetical protein
MSGATGPGPDAAGRATAGPAAPGGAPGRPFGRLALAGLALGLALLGVAYTLPLVLYGDTALPFAAVPPEGREIAERVQGDYLQFYYYLWLVRERVLGGASPLRDPFQFAVDGARSNLPNLFLPFALLYLPLSLLGPRLAYNLLVWLSFPLAGLGAALLAHRYGLGRPAAAVAAAVFACLPYRTGALLGGHPAGMAFGLVPLALWGLEGALAGSRAGGLWCGLALLAIAIVEPHFFYFAALGLPVYLLARVGLAGSRREGWRVGAAWWTLALALALAVAGGTLAALERRGFTAPLGGWLGVAALVGLGVLAAWQCGAGWLVAGGVVADGRAAARRSLLACLPWVLLAAAGTRVGARLALAGAGALGGAAFLLLLRQALLRRSVSGGGRTLHEVFLFSPIPEDLLIRANPFAARAVYVGVVAFGLAVVGAIVLWRRGLPGGAPILRSYPVLFAAGLALSLGPRLPALPVFEAAFTLVPLWNFVRQPAKFQIVTGLALAVLAAVGTEALGRAGGRRRVALVSALLVLAIAADYHPWRPTGVSRLPTGGPGYDTVRALGPRALWIPLWPGDSSFSGLYLYATTLARVPMLNGYSAWIDRAYVSDVYHALEPVNLGQVGEAEHATLRQYGVRQVILDRSAFPLKVSPFGPAFTLAGLRRSPYLELARAPGNDEAQWVFRVRERPAPAPDGPPPRSALGIYWEAESLRRDTGRIAADAEASNGHVVLGRAGRDPPGFLTFGPYRLLPPGAFRALFRLRGEDTVVELQVTTSGGRELLGARALRPAGLFEEVAVPFRVDALAAVEYRVKWNGTGTVAADAVSITFADVPDPPLALEVEALSHELGERADPDASGGVAGYADPARTPRDALWSGPLRRYPAGRYRLWVRLKVDRPVDGPLAWCSAQAASRGPVLGARELAGAEVPAPGRYVELAVPFVLRRATVLEFPCLYRGAGGVWFDRLRIEGPLA